MKRTTKSLWLYTAILFIVAIALIFSTTLMQARLINSDGNIEVLSSFTKNVKQNITELTDQNISLSNELNALKSEYETLKTDFDLISDEAAKQSRQKEIMRQMYVAFRYEKYEELKSLFKIIEEQNLITKEEADSFIPQLYDRAKNFLEENS